MLGLIYRFFSSHRFESFPSNSEYISEGKLHEVESFEGEVIESDILIAVLCCLDGKKGGDVTGNFEDRESFDRFVELLNSMGLNCFVDFSPELTEAENMKNLLDEESSGELEDQLQDAEIRARIFMTKDDSYDLDFFRKLLVYQKFTARYHRLYGEFLGFPEENIDCFTYHQRSRFFRKVLDLVGRGQPDMISDWELADRHREELSERQYQSLRAFVYSIYPDEEGSLDKALERSEERRELLEEYSLDAEAYAELFLDW